MSALFDLKSQAKDSVDFIVREINYVAERYKKRAPCAKTEREAAEYMAGLLEADCGCVSAALEEFTAHPAAFYGCFFFAVFFGLFCCLFCFVYPPLSILFGMLTFVIFTFQFLMYKPMIDPAFPEKKSVNVTAVRPCYGEVKRRVFFSGHIDAAWEFPLNYYFGGFVFKLPGLFAVIGVTLFTVISAAKLAGAGSWTGTFSLFGLVFVPAFILVGFTYNPKRTVDGANDDLTGCFLSVSLLYAMEKLNVSLEHTEIGVILTGCEEAGLRGAKAWSRMHIDRSDGIPTYIICIDTIHCPDNLAVNLRDLNGTVKADGELGGLILRAANDAGVECRKSWIPPFGGSTDSAAFTQGGFRSVALTGLSHKLEDYYHTRRDTAGNLNVKGLENCFLACSRALELIDSGALDN